MNDNFSTEKRTVQLLLCDGDKNEQEEIPDGSCDMNFANLYTGLDLSLMTHSAGGNVINRLAAFQDLWKVAKKMLKCLCGKKNKCYEQYEKMMGDSGGTRDLRLPNETRVAGVLLLIQDFLCSFHTICEHGNKFSTFNILVLPRVAWQQLSGFEAIMRKAYSLCFESQSNHPETST